MDQLPGERIKLAGGAVRDVNGTGAGKPVFRLKQLPSFEATFLRSSFGQGFRFPTIAERCIRTGLGVLQIYPNESCLNFPGQQKAAKRIRQNTRIGDIVGFFDLALFRQEYEDYIEHSATGADEGEINHNAYGLGFMSNTGGSRAASLETSITGRLTTEVSPIFRRQP